MGGGNGGQLDWEGRWKVMAGDEANYWTDGQVLLFHSDS